MNNFLNKTSVCMHKKELLYLFLLICFVHIINAVFFNGFNYIDGDDFMRVIRTREFFEHFDIFNNTIARGNFPYGCELHWTRFYDVFIILPSYCISFLTNDIHQAIDIVCICISPLLQILFVYICFKTINMFFSSEASFIISCMFITNPILISYFSLGRPDHHAFIFMFSSLYIMYVAKILLNKFRDTKDILLLGLISALCIWISPETLILLIITDVMFVIYCLCFEISFEKIYLKNALIAALIMLIIMYPTFLKIEYDKISIVHHVLYSFSTVYLYVLECFTKRKSLKHKICIAIIFGIIFALLFLCIFPQFIYGMMGNLSEELKIAWLYKISEMKSPISMKMNIFYFSVCGLVIASINNLLKKICDKVAIEQNLFFIYMSLLSVVFLILSGYSSRIIPYIFIVATPLIFMLCDDKINASNKFIKCLMTNLSIVLLIAVTFNVEDGIYNIFSSTAESELKVTYKEKDLYAAIDNLSKEPIVILSSYNEGVKILFYTKHCAIGANYHRQHQGILTTHEILFKDFDEQKIKQLLKLHNIKYIFLYKSKYEHKNCFFYKLQNKYLPTWLANVKLDEKFSNVLIFKVNL